MPTSQVSVRTYSGEQTSHRHEWDQIIVPLEGTLTLAVGAREGRVRRLAGGIVRGGERHAFAAKGTNRFVVIDVDTQELSAVEAARAWLDRAGRGIFFDLDPVLVDTARCAAASSDRSSSALRGEWARLLVLMIAERSVDEAAKARSSSRLRNVLAFIEQNASRQLTVAEMAAVAELGESQVHWLFRHVVGCTPQEYATRVRLAGARNAVATTEQSLASIALDWGYADQASFTRAFRRQFGFTPGAQRRVERRSKRP